MKKKWTRALALVCTLALALTLAVPGFAGGEVVPAPPENFAYGKFMQGTENDSGYEWKLEEDGTLTIRGTRMWNENQTPPWYFFCEDITNVIIEQGMQNIGGNAFLDCTSMASVLIPSSVTSIGDGAFNTCSSLTSVVIPDGVTSIDDNVFRWCKGLTSVTIPDGVTSIGDGAFWGCKGLISVVIPDGVTSIGNYVFHDCSSLTGVAIPNGVTSIGDSAFNTCSSLTSVTIPNGVTSIGNSAFYDCTGLTGSLTFPSSVTSIGESAFGGCYNLTSITIPASVKSIGNDAFSAGAVGATHYFGGAGYICQRKILFKGNAPQFEAGEDSGEALHFGYIAATVYYPQNDATWTEAVRQQYGGQLTWVACDPANPPDISSEDPATPTEPETPTQPEQPTQPETPTQPEQPTQPETPAQPEQPTQPDTPANPATPGQIAGDLAQQVIASGGNYDLARQLLESLLNDKQIFIDARITEAMRLAIEAAGGIGHGHQVTDSAYVYAAYPQSFTEALQFARAEVNASANSFTLDMSFPEGRQSPLGVYMTVYLKEGFNTALEYRWYCDDGSAGAANVAACDNNGYRTCVTFYAPHFSTYTVRPVNSMEPFAPADTAGSPILKRTGGDISGTMGIVLALAAATVLVCAFAGKKKSNMF